MGEVSSAHRRRALSILAITSLVAVLVPTVLGALVGLLWVGLVVGVLAAAAWVWWVWERSERHVLAALRARVAPPEEFRRLHNLVDGLHVTAGVPRPDLWVVDSPSPNACAVGRDPNRAGLVFTTGLLEDMSRIELEGIVAALLAEVRSGDTFLDGIAAAVAAPVARIGHLADPIVSAIASPDRRTRSDVAGCRLTRYPPGMIAALERLRSAPPGPVTPPTLAHIWWLPVQDRDESTLDERISMLREL
jgi:heat shock protein HtpX